MANLTGKALRFNTVRGGQSLPLTLAPGELSSESVQELGFILTWKAFLCRGLNSRFRTSLKAGTWQTVTALSKTLQLLNGGKVDPGIPLTSEIQLSPCSSTQGPSLLTRAAASHFPVMLCSTLCCLFPEKP